MKLAVAFVFVSGVLAAQEAVPLQPLAQQVRQLEEALNYLGDPLPAPEVKQIDAAIGNQNEAAAVAAIQAALDKHVLAVVDINAESRVKVEQGAAMPDLLEDGTRLFLVKVVNRAGVTAELKVVSPNSGNMFLASTGDPQPEMKLTKSDAADRWADISLYHQAPMKKRLSGLGLEYQILEVYSRDAGRRAAKISFNVGQGSQDIGFRNDINVLFNAEAATPVTLHITDENGQPAMASFVIRDRLNRLYPAPSKRLAPDFFFQPQVYRQDGETVGLPEGYYTVQFTGGPEYLTRTHEFAVGIRTGQPFI